MNKRFLKILSIGLSIVCILSCSFLFSACKKELLQNGAASTVMAKRYISIGDSIAAGYALPDYEIDGQNTLNSFAFNFANDAGFSDYIDLAITGCDTQDVLDSFSEYKESGCLKNATVVTLAIGSNDILRPSLELMCKACGVKNSDELIQKFSTLSNKGKLMDLLGLVGSIWNTLTSEETKTLLSNQVEVYKANIIKIVDNIRDIAPNAKIYLINYYNPYKGLAFGALDIGEIVDPYIQEMNQFVSEHEYSGVHYFLVDVSSIDSNYTNVSLDTSNLALDPHPNTEGHKFISDALFESYTSYNDAKAILWYEDGSSPREYYKSASEAWNAANTILDKDLKITLLSDWISDANYKMGSGAGFGSTGTIRPVDRSNKESKLILDLNDHVVNRCLPSKVSEGEVFELRKDGTFTIKNGTVTGGNNTGNGGAFWIDNNETTVYLENLIISGNETAKNGAGIYIRDCSAHVTLSDCTIIANTSTGGYGGGMYFADGNAKVLLQGKIIIRDNKAKQYRENLTVQRTGWFNTGYPTIWVGVLTRGSKIYFNVSSNDQTSDVFYVDEDTMSRTEAIDQYSSYFKLDNTKLKSVISVKKDAAKTHSRYALDIDK